jgi:phosphoglycolate phosphatase-like HAD superfamily hydrolase
MRIITDFDGPIMDLSDRYYHVYQLCLARVRQPEQSLKIRSKAEFWAGKRAQIPDRQIGLDSGLTAVQADEFQQLRNYHAHRLEYLDLDRVVPGAISALERIQSAGIELLVMTLRRTRELEPALDRYDLARFFPPDYRYCLANDYLKHGDIPAKTQMMTQALRDLKPEPDTWMIGDTEADIIAAQTHQIRSIGVLSGIRNYDRLAMHQPDRIVKDLAEAVDSLLFGETTDSPQR